MGHTSTVAAARPRAFPELRVADMSRPAAVVLLDIDTTFRAGVVLEAGSDGVSGRADPEGVDPAGGAGPVEGTTGPA